MKVTYYSIVAVTYYSITLIILLYLLFYCLFYCYLFSFDGLAIWEAVVRIERNSTSLVNEHNELKASLEALQTSLQFTQADVDDLKKDNQKLKDKMAG